MAKWEVESEWVNDSYFELKGKLNDGSWVQIIRMEENGSMSAMWDNISSALKLYFNTMLKQIGEDMAK